MKHFITIMFMLCGGLIGWAGATFFLDVVKLHNRVDRLESRIKVLENATE